MKKASDPNSQLRKIATLCFLFLLLILNSCKDDIEGCKDIAANNWNASADKSCEDCCTYPELKVIFEHAYGDTSFQYRVPYEDDFANVYSILSIRYYLSNFILKTDEAEFIVTDSLETIIFENGQSERTMVHDDVGFITIGTSTSSIGDFPTNNQYLDSLFFSLGLVEPLNSVSPGAVPNSHPLAPKADSMYWDETRGYIFQRLQFIPDTAATDTILLEIGEPDLLEQVNLAYAKTSTTGFDQEIQLKVDYKCWFTGINFAVDTEAEMKEKIVNNMAKSFSITQ